MSDRFALPRETPATQVGTQRVYDGRTVRVDVDTVRFPNGKTGELEMIRHPGASAVLPFLSDPQGEDPQLLLIRQFRYATDDGTRDGFILEIPAGKLDGDEDPAVCAARELKEETGCSAERFEKLTTIYTTPGFTDEVIHLFMATGVTHGEAETEEHEFVEPVVMRMSEVLEKVKSGEIVDSKTIIAVMYAAGFVMGR